MVTFFLWVCVMFSCFFIDVVILDYTCTWLHCTEILQLTYLLETDWLELQPFSAKLGNSWNLLPISEENLFHASFPASAGYQPAFLDFSWYHANLCFCFHSREHQTLLYLLPIRLLWLHLWSTEWCRIISLLYLKILHLYLPRPYAILGNTHIAKNILNMGILSHYSA